MPEPHAPPPDARQLALYQRVVQQAVQGGGGLMGKLVASARLALQAQEAKAQQLSARDRLAEAAQLLRVHEQALCQGFAEALHHAVERSQGSNTTAVPLLTELHFSELEHMDAAQIDSTVALGRLRQRVHQAVGAVLADMDKLVSSVWGLAGVQARANALRPGAYVRALQDVVEKAGVAPAMQVLWYQAMAATLGQELRSVYAAAAVQLQAQGTDVLQPRAENAAPTAFSTGTQSPLSPVQGAADMAGPATEKPQSLLTLDKLHRLLSGELRPAQSANRVQQFAAQFAQQFEGQCAAPASAAPDFDSTLPAALEALTEMEQVDQVVQRLEQRQTAAAHAPQPVAHSVEGQRLALRHSAKDVAQALSLEVVTLMVDNMAQDPRLLAPVRQVLRNLEPALLRLVLQEPRFFTDKQHPARRLLQAVSLKSMAFASEDAAGFDAFHQDLVDTLRPLFAAQSGGAQAFEDRLTALEAVWSGGTAGSQQERDAAVEVLRHAEARNLQAEKVARQIEAHPDSAQVPAVVIEFLCGPWAQVVAQAHIKQGPQSAAAEKFEALIPAMLWSAHPALARADTAKLTRLVPRLLATLREGLDTIQYPGTRTSVFLEALMALHQQAFRPAAAQTAGQAVAFARTHPVEEGAPWMAPQEAEASNFVELEFSSTLTHPQTEPLMPDLQFASAPAPAVAEVEMPVGSWVELWHNNQWTRMQLTWASPHGTLFLFTGVYGATQSLSRRSRDKMLEKGKLRLLAGPAFVEGALDAVAQVAMRNSMDTQM